MAKQNENFKKVKEKVTDIRKEVEGEDFVESEPENDTAD